MTRQEHAKTQTERNSDPMRDCQQANYDLIARAISFITEQQSSQPSLQQIASALKVSESHLHRTFSEWAGVSPKQFLQFLTKEHAIQTLRSMPVLETAHELGLSSGSRLYDLMITFDSVTPGELRSGGAGMQIRYGTHRCRFGFCFIALTDRGICKLALFDQIQDAQQALAQLQKDWPHAQQQEDKEQTRRVVEQAFAPVSDFTQPLHLVMKGSPFKLKVWEALLKIPFGELRTYQDIAKAIGQPSAARAAASAIASNDIAMMIPCHRVIRSSGELSQ